MSSGLCREVDPKQYVPVFQVKFTRHCLFEIEIDSLFGVASFPVELVPSGVTAPWLVGKKVGCR
jgi:hypothetical protein